MDRERLVTKTKVKLARLVPSGSHKGDSVACLSLAPGNLWHSLTCRPITDLCFCVYVPVSTSKCLLLSKDTSHVELRLIHVASSQLDYP